MSEISRNYKYFKLQDTDKMLSTLQTCLPVGKPLDLIDYPISNLQCFLIPIFAYNLL